MVKLDSQAVIEDRLKPGNRTDNRVTDYRRHESRHQRFHLEVLFVKNLRRDNGASQRSFENCRYARAQSGSQRDIALAGSELQRIGDACASGRADLRNWSFAPRSQPAANRDRRRYQFEKIEMRNRTFSLLWNARIAALVPIPAVVGANFQVSNPPPNQPLR